MEPANDDFQKESPLPGAPFNRKPPKNNMRGSSKQVNLTFVWRSGVIPTGVFPWNIAINHASAESQNNVLYRKLSFIIFYPHIGSSLLWGLTVSYAVPPNVKNISTNSDLAAGQNPFSNRKYIHQSGGFFSQQFPR